MIIKLFKNRIFLFVLFILIAGIFICIYIRNDISKENKKVLDSLSSVNARYGYSFNQRLNKKLLFIYYVDKNNFKKVIEILPMLKVPYSIGMSKAELNQIDILKLSQSNLTVLNLVECTSVPDWSILEKLSTCKNLKEFGMGGHNTDMSIPIKSFNKFLRIKSFAIVACKISVEYFDGIKELQLENLYLTASTIPNECMSMIADCQSIKFISLRHCKFCDCTGVRMLSKMKNITELDLMLCHLPEKVLDSFIDHPSLKKIYVHEAYLSQDDIKLIEDKTNKSKLPQIIGIPTAFSELTNK
jgi:hypothetical protein